MRKILITTISAILISFITLTFISFGKVSKENQANEYLKQAHNYYEEYKKDYKNKDLEAKAKKYYQEAAKTGNADAHFALAYQFVLSDEESVYHLTEAAKKGHEKALDYALEKLLFRANSLKVADPQRALDLYYQAKKANPNLKLYDEESTVRTMKMCAEPKGFDAEEFMKKYDVKDEDDNFPFYDVWELAEEASIGGRFGEPNPELVLNLVCRGSWVPMELKGAAYRTYNNWKNGINEEFNICQHITSGAGMGYCASRSDIKDRVKREQKLNLLKNKVGKSKETLLNEAYESALTFINNKVDFEEAHGGTGRAAFEISSRMSQENKYLDLIEKIADGYIPEPKTSYKKTDEKLNKTYKEVLEYLKDKPSYMPSPNAIQKVQIKWIPYRDASAKLFASVNPSTNEELWKNWLTEIREKQLKDILNL